MPDLASGTTTGRSPDFRYALIGLGILVLSSAFPIFASTVPAERLPKWLGGLDVITAVALFVPAVILHRSATASAVLKAPAGCLTWSTKSFPKIRSRSRSRNCGAVSHGNASRSCWTVHSGRGMGGYGEMQYASPLVRQHQEDIQIWNRIVGTVKKSTETILFTWFSRKVLHVWDGGLLRRTMYLLTLVSPMSMPSLSSSP